jgi:hypothetical protein
MKTQNYLKKDGGTFDGRSVTVVRNFFKLERIMASVLCHRRKGLVVRRIKRDAVINELSAKQIIKENQLNISRALPANNR